MCRQLIVDYLESVDGWVDASEIAEVDGMPNPNNVRRALMKMRHSGEVLYKLQRCNKFVYKCNK